MNNPHTSRILGSLVIALAIIVSAWIFRGSAADLWIETTLTGAALSFLILKRPACTPRSR